MQIKRIEVRQFRCFSHYCADFERPLTLIEGENGSGKTSLLEAIHYLCYVRSFRTYNSRYLVKQGGDGFFIKASFAENAELGPVDHELQIGFADKKKLAKLDGKPIASYKELMDHYRIITICELDLELINGSPEIRRSFMDQAILLSDPSHIALCAQSRKLVEHRNSLLQRGCYNEELYRLWTHQLWEKTLAIQATRRALVAELEGAVNNLLGQWFPEVLPMSIRYMPKRDMAAESFDEFWTENSPLFAQERDHGYCLMGPHLDDCAIGWQGDSSKLYASRGQQKLIILLLKLALVELIKAKKGPVVLLVDDFLTDFDKKRATNCLNLVNQLPCQAIVTCPQDTGFLGGLIDQMNGSRLSLTK